MPSAAKNYPFPSPDIYDFQAIALGKLEHLFDLGVDRKHLLLLALSTFPRIKHVLDLYAGSGSLGLESLSRGAISSTFVDQAPWAKKIREKLRIRGVHSYQEFLEDVAVQTFALAAGFRHDLAVHFGRNANEELP